ncbi:hypothetical protein ACINNAV81_1601 [Acinetobacter baumannii Naval-81]|nr:hypothetical protein ACINNAV81_1601 [Acinetobacter baumannii Naval-81]
MSRIYIIKNALDQQEKITVESENILHTFLQEKPSIPKRKSIRVILALKMI